MKRCARDQRRESSRWSSRKLKDVGPRPRLEQRIAPIRGCYGMHRHIQEALGWARFTLQRTRERHE